MQLQSELSVNLLRSPHWATSVIVAYDNDNEYDTVYYTLVHTRGYPYRPPATGNACVRTTRETY